MDVSKHVTYADEEELARWAAFIANMTEEEFQLFLMEHGYAET